MAETADARTMAHHLRLCSIFLDTTNGEFALIHKNLRAATTGAPMSVSFHHFFYNIRVNDTVTPLSLERR
jgi:hypothetical protein